MSKKIQIKDVSVLDALLNRIIHPRLIEIILWVATEYGLCFTEGWRDLGRAGDVHNTNPLRAVDLRSWFYQPKMAQYIEEQINLRWEYDPDRPEKKVAWIHDSGQGVHFHVQVHKNTKKRPETYGEIM